MLQLHGVMVLRGGPFDRWDLDVRTGMFGGIRLLTAIEEHGSGKQVFRVRVWPHSPPRGVGFSLIFALLGLAAAINGAWLPLLVLSGPALFFLIGMLGQCASAMALALGSLDAEPIRAGEAPTDVTQCK